METMEACTLPLCLDNLDGGGTEQVYIDTQWIQGEIGGPPMEDVLLLAQAKLRVLGPKAVMK